jgi:hypothetical protein
MTLGTVIELSKGRDHVGPTVEERRQKGPECNNSIRNRSSTATSWKERTSGRISRKTVELKIEKRIVRSSAGLRGVNGYCGGVGPFPRRKKRLQKHWPQKIRSGGMHVGYSR